jgi:hypothetical protein
MKERNISYANRALGGQQVWMNTDWSQFYFSGRTFFISRDSGL